MIRAIAAGARRLLFMALLGFGAASLPQPAHAQAGPPYLSNDPGTPGNTNWEINLAVAPTLTRAGGLYQAPQVDLNYGLGDRIQLTYEIPYEFSSTSGAGRASGWGNAFWGVKWRFLDQGEEGFKASLFPQVEQGGTLREQAVGLAGPGPRYLLPFEVTKKIGEYDLDFEIGEYFPKRGPHERIMGFVVGRSISEKLEFDAELYDDRAAGSEPRQTTLDLGGRYKLHPGIIALFMVGRSVGAGGPDSAQLFGYIGVQILLTDYGLALNRSE